MAKTETVHHFKTFVKKHHRGLVGAFLALFLCLLFIISVSGGLRVFFPYLGQLTGLPFGHKKYLVVFQNNNELRPAGGFISSFATVDFTAGILSGLKIEDVYGTIDDHPYQEPPYPMVKLLANEWYKGYSFRDGNYSPNFPDSARELIRLYHLTRPNEPIDGVVAINFEVLQRILTTLGPVKIDEKVLNDDNLFEELTNQVNDVDRHNEESLANRKSVLKPLANAIIQKIILNPFKLRKISDTVTQALSRKDIQLYFTSNDLQTLAQRNHWAGEWPSSNLQSDFFAVNEANLGGMKSDRYLQRNVTYHLRISEDTLINQSPAQADASVTIKHFGIENIPLSGPYTGYFRIFKRPEQLSTAYQTTFPSQLFNEIVKLNPGQSTTIQTSYEVPATVIKDHQYSLYIPKQSGTKEDFYTIIIELPRGYRTESDSFETRENFGYYQGTLDKDLQLQLKIVPDQTPPNLILQENTELNKVSLHFNEDLNQDYANDPFSYQVTDLNLKHPETTDTLSIKKVVTTSKDVDLYLNGQTAQPEERYGVRLKNLRDTHGNVLSDRQITVVQRLK